MKHANRHEQLPLKGMENEATREDVRRAEISLSLLDFHNRKRIELRDELANNTQPVRDAMDQEEAVTEADAEQVTEFEELSDEIESAKMRMADRFKKLQSVDPTAARKYLERHAGVRSLVKRLLDKEG